MNLGHEQIPDSGRISEIYRKMFSQKSFCLDTSPEEQKKAFVETITAAAEGLMERAERTMTATERLDFNSLMLGTELSAENGTCTIRLYIGTIRKHATMTEILNDPTFQKAMYDGTSNMEGLI